jgi:uncharacterized protein (DUF697 family)
MKDDRGTRPRGTSARGRAGEPAAPPPRKATTKPPAAIFMEPAIPAPRESEPEPNARHPVPRDATPGPVVPGNGTPGRTAPARTAPAKAAPAKPAEPAEEPLAGPVDQAEPAKSAAPQATAPAVQATDPAKRAPAAKTTPAKTTAAKTTPAKSAAKSTPAKTAAGAAAKRTAAAKTTATKAAPRVEASMAEPAPIAVRPDTLWDRLRADPGQARELLARAAVERYGPEADRYTRWIRGTYPGAAADDRVAQAAARRFTAQARRGVLAGIVAREAGEATALAWLQARMVLHIAAAYRHDPTAAERAGELLALMTPPRVPARVAAAAVGRRIATRLVPGAGLLLGAFVNDAATEALARRAMSLYRPVPRLP